MTGHPGTAIDPALLRPEMWIADVVYFPRDTELLRAARARGCRTLDGGGMAVLQAAEAFRLLTGAEPDANRMLGEFRLPRGPARHGRAMLAAVHL
jgi:shikimate dehydrogenase